MGAIKILYFARLRDQLECAEETYELPSERCTVDELKQQLSQRGDAWQQAFADNQLLVAVNQTMAHGETVISADDEVGFFPPVTGG